MASGGYGAVSSPVMAGCVYLVGAGPGSVDLLTLRALEVLRSCDVVLHDRLVPPEVVRLAKPTATVTYVGKGTDVSTAKMKVQQDDISSQLVALAKEGKSVCRLKGGDPSIFGRVGEEMEELCAGEVPFEVVPAVTACLAASADARVPLTFRNCATAVRVQTMNPSTIKDERFDWSQFAAPGTTFALYMGLNVVEGVTQKMLCAGVAPGTPMALVDRASLPEMQVVAGTVETLPELVKERSDLPGPALILMGEVVGLRERIAGLRAPVPTLGQPAIASVLAQLPSLSDDELRQLQQEVEETRQQRKRKREELEAS
ncbi:Siroheme synthase [Includes: Uroporphyrinogen-III C-methyltransferase (Urogen III methylase) (SUMT) (Uroporphyrinogen III methylase) (UROM) [Durusdinium trenchii]|uniref:uroporphyrinogen-III C-methyltransferase n=1 Tax=Durusdinium trenchii TaxID=1381693 RepID=A0ABP0QSM8_9DINO